jgi:predicted NBD/HSP70 family sugar kinase
MAFTDITSTAEVRAVLGVSEKELHDDVLLLPLYTTQLTGDIDALHAQMLADFAATAPLATKTDDQERFVNLVQAYAAYHIAKQCLGAVAMFAPARISAAGKSEAERVPDAYAQLRIDVPTTLSILRTRLRAAYARLNPDATPPAPAERLAALAATPGTSPITGS